MKRSVLAVAVGLSFVGAAAGAQMPMARPIHVGVSAGATIPVSDAAKSTGGEPAGESKVGYNVNGLVEFSVPVLPLGLRAEFMYNSLEGKEVSVDDPDLGTITAQADNRILGGSLNALLSGSGIAIQPYAIAGVGVYNVQTTAKFSGPGFGSEDFKQKDTNFGLNGGIGIRFPLGGMSTFVEARYHYIFNSKDCSNSDVDVCVDRDNTSIIPISFGVMF